MENSFIVVLITVPSEEVGKQIANVLLENRLAACVNITDSIQSLYIWQGHVIQDQERLLIIKTRSDIFEDKFVPAVRSVHPYDVPEIIGLPIMMGSNDYLDWIKGETTS